MSYKPTEAQLDALTNEDYLAVCREACEGLGLVDSDYQFEHERDDLCGGSLEECRSVGFKVYSYPVDGRRMEMGIGWSNDKLDLYWN